jgi:hypothetical protein
MTPNPQLMTAVEQLGYRVTGGDVAMQIGVHLEQARSGLLDLANQTGGHLAVTDTGEIIYTLPQDFRQILLRKSIRLRIQAWLRQIWTVVFYLIKISFGILLIASIAVVYLTILVTTSSSSGDGGDGGDFGDCVLAFGSWGNGSSATTTASLDPDRQRSSGIKSPIRAKTQRKSMNFLEAVFSVLFGDGSPNADLERRRWSYIGNTIHRNRGAVIGEQIAPFLDNLGVGYDREYETYMLPVLTKFNGIPEVSPTGQLVYHFPDLQTTLRAASGEFTRVPQILRERKWKFSLATPTQTNGAISLGVANLAGIAFLAMRFGGTGSSFVSIVLAVLAIYGIGLAVIPLCRYLWIDRQNRQVQQRNHYRQQQVKLLQQDESIQTKLDYAQQFAKQHQITDRDIIYTTTEDALDQEFKRLESDKDS